jgi:hypothetical protein
MTSIGTGPSYQTQRQKAPMHHSLTKSMPHLNDVAADLVVRLRLPDGRRNRNPAGKALPPGSKEQKGRTAIPPEAQQTMAQMKQQMKRNGRSAGQGRRRGGQAGNTEAAEHANHCVRRPEVDRFKAETERLKLVMPLLNQKSLRSWPPAWPASAQHA